MVFGFLGVGLCAQALADSGPPAPLVAKDAPTSCALLDWTLRLDFSNIDLLTCRENGFLPYQQGALLSWAQDELAHTHSGSGEGVAALMVHLIGEYKPFIGLVAGPYLQGDGTYQFASASTPIKRSDTVTEGGFLQFGFRDGFIDPSSQEYFRFRGGEAEATTGIKTTDFVAEWVPRATLNFWGCKVGIYKPTELPCGTEPFISVKYLFTPELMIQSDHLDDGPRKYLLFAHKTSDLRIGPQLSLAVSPYYALPCNSWEQFANKWTLSTVYHLATETMAGRGYAWVQTSLTYNALDFLGVSVSYGAGNSETSGNVTSEIKIGLTLKH